MNLLEQVGLGLFARLDPERAHGLALKALNMGGAPQPGPISTPRLQTRIAGLTLPNPVGLAAGFDKNAVAIAPLMHAGFGFIELGAATPRPQPGNPKPRLFRLPQDRAVINRFGFNNDGADAIARRLANRPPGIPVGLNLGANKDSADRMSDFASVLETCGADLDFATVNVSSPNTERLRDLQGKAALTTLLEGVLERARSLPKPVPIFLKISPDLEPQEINDICDVALSSGVDAIVATNTTLARDGLISAKGNAAGGLSGAPLFERSTRVLAAMARRTGGRIPLIGVGGIGSAQDAYAKIKAGASGVQLYTAMVYQGLSLIPRIIRDLDKMLTADGFQNLSEAVGIEKDKWQ